MAAKGFRRQRVLDVKEVLLKIEALALRRQEDAHLEVLNQLVRSQQAKENYFADGSDRPEEIIFQGPQELMVRSRHTLRLNEDIRQYIDQARRTRDAVDEQRHVVAEAAKAKQTLEKLRDH